MELKPAQSAIGRSIRSDSRWRILKRPVTPPAGFRPVRCFADLDELKHLLLKRKDQFANCLIKKRLTYALGRELSYPDRPQFDAITETRAARGYGLHDLVDLVHGRADRLPNRT